MYGSVEVGGLAKIHTGNIIPFQREKLPNRKWESCMF